MDFLKSPSEKLDCLIESTTIMTDVLKLTQVNEGAASADSILPISIFILLKACPTRLWSNIKYLFHSLQNNSTHKISLNIDILFFVIVSLARSVIRIRCSLKSGIVSRKLNLQLTSLPTSFQSKLVCLMKSSTSKYLLSNE